MFYAIIQTVIDVFNCFTFGFICCYWQCVVESVHIDDDSLLKSLIDLAESTPKFLRPQLENIFSFVLTVEITLTSQLFSGKTLLEKLYV